jgi:predicted RNase H-like HicB family nuclease
MKHYEFKVVLDPDPSGGYVVTCPSIPGCYSQGETIAEALKNVREAIALCLEDMRAHKEKLPDPAQTLMGTVGVDV